ncbi:MAG: TonB-dependent receptor [Elusimicrobia bacterium]|nr:TonB-dependent receptor [Elusimicrobiota bacterium]
MVPTRIAALAAVLSCVPAAASAVALTEDSLFREVRAASRLPDAPTDERRYPGTVRVFDAADLRRLGGDTLADAIGRLPGVILYNQSGNPFMPTLDLRGWNASPGPATIVLVDGVRVNEADLGQVNWQLMPLESVERVEVLPGPNTIYGKDALAGVIAIFTKRGTKKTEGSASAGIGSYGRADADASVRGQAGAFDYSVFGSHAREDGYRRGASSRMTEIIGSLGRRTDKDDVRLVYTFADDRLDQGGSLTQGEFEADPRQRVSIVKTDNLLNGVTLNARRTLVDGLSGAVMTQFRERLENTPLNRGRNSTSKNSAHLRSAGGAGQLTADGTIADRRLTLNGGVEGSRSDAESTSAGDFGGFPSLTATGTRDTRLGSWLTGSADLWPSGPTVTAGARWDRTTIDFKNRVTPANDGLRSYARTSPRVGLNWEAGGGASLRASYSEAFRAPTSGELSALGPFASSPDLLPVKTKSWETGAGWRHPAWGEADVTVYRALASDEIYAIYNPILFFGENRNISRTRRQGIEVSLRPRIGKADAWLDYSYTEATFQDRFDLDNALFTGTQSVTPGSDIPMVPRNRLSLGASVPLPLGLRAGAGGQCVGSSRFFGDEANLEGKMPGYCTLDLDASLERGAWTLSLSGRNALDERYATRGILGGMGGRLERFVVPAVGRTVSARLRWRFGAP